MAALYFTGRMENDGQAIRLEATDRWDNVVVRVTPQALEENLIWEVRRVAARKYSDGKIEIDGSVLVGGADFQN